MVPILSQINSALIQSSVSETTWKTWA